jgi:phosphate transport system permease protein
MTSARSTSSIRPISGRRRAFDAAARGLVLVAFGIALIPLVWVLTVTIGRGIAAVVGSTWWTNSQRGVLPDQFTGGAYHAIYGTLVQALIAAVFAVPLGVFIAIYLVEYGRGVIAKTATFMVDVLSGLPSIVAALFVFALWITTLGQQQSAFAVALALGLLMLPVVVRSTEEMLRLVPNEIRESAYALGIPKWVTIVRVVLPSASSGILSGILLAIARIMGETAPVLVLVGYSSSLNFDVFTGNMASLPLFIYTQLINPLAAGSFRAWGAALTLVILIAALTILARVGARLLSHPTR